MFKTIDIPKALAVQMIADIQVQVDKDKHSITTLDDGHEDFKSKYRGLRSSIFAMENVIHALKPHTEQ